MNAEGTGTGAVRDGEGALPDLWARVRAGDAAAREQAIEANLGLVRHVVRRFAAPGFDVDDLFQLGCLGLVKAVDRFDPGLGVRFSTYAVPLILGEVRGFLRDDGPLRVSREVKRVARRIRQKEDELSAVLGRAPSLAELAAALDMDRAELAAALESSAGLVSLHQPAVSGEPDGPTLEECVAGPEAAGWDDAVALRTGLARLEPRLRRIVELRFYGDCTQQEIARLLGISQVQVSRLEKKALTTLRAFLE